MILILLGSIFINVFKKSNIGVVLTATLANIIGTNQINGLLLIIALFIISAISTLFLTGASSRWSILSSTAIPAFMNSSLSPEFAQVIARFGECMTLGLTPLLAYFTIYIAYIEKYNQSNKPINLFRTLKYQIIYGISIGLILLAIAIGWYLIGIPIGIGGTVTA